jgi:hypothetical protein
MSTRNKSPNASVSIHQLLRLLGCRVRLCGTPFQTQCPICGGVLTVLRDFICGGGWHDCRNCGSCGDLIELAAATLNLPVADTIAYLAREGIGIPMDAESIHSYVEEHLEYRKRLDNLWNTARRLTASEAAPTDGARRKGYPWDDKWFGSESVGLMIGLTTVTAVEKCFSPANMQAALARGHRTNTGAHRVFVGQGWNEVRAVAFYDLPGRISAFLFFGRDGHPDRDFVLKRANRGFRGNQVVRSEAEGGLAFHPNLFDGKVLEDRTVVAVDDPQLMLKLQSRHLRSDLRPVPLVTWLDTAQRPKWKNDGRRTRTGHAWQMFDGCQIVFWCPAGVTIHVVRQAIAVEGCIAVTGPRSAALPGALDDYLKHLTPSEVIDRVVRNAVPWNEFLSGRFEEGSMPEVCKWVHELEFEQEPLDAIVSRLSIDAQRRVATLRQQHDAPKTIEINGRIIREAHRCWLHERRGKPPSQILNAVLRLEQILIDREQGREYVSGRILFEDQVIPFFEPYRTLQTNLTQFLGTLVLQQGGGLLQFKNTAVRDLLAIAINFHEPQRVEAVTRVGWDPSSDRFVFPHFQIEHSGKVAPLDGAVLSPNAPGGRLVPPTEANTIPAQMLCVTSVASELAKVFWATLACMISNIVGPNVGVPSSGLCLVGRGAQTAGLAIARALGCASVRLSQPSDLDKVLLAEHAHGMPVLCEFRTGLVHRAVREFFEHAGIGRNCIIPVDWHTSRLLLVRGGWHVIQCDQALDVPEHIGRAAALVVPAFLRHFLAVRDFDDADGPSTPVGQILWQLADFVHKQNGNPDEVYTAAQQLQADCPQTARDAFVDLLGRLLADNCLTLVTPDKVGKRPNLIMDALRDQLLLSHGDFETAVRKVPVWLPPATQLLKRIAHSRAGAHDADYYQLPLSASFARWQGDSSLRRLPQIVRNGLPSGDHNESTAAALFAGVSDRRTPAADPGTGSTDHSTQ